jgi:lipopolysaccharide export system protein LptA
MVGLGKQKVDEGATTVKGHADNTKVTEDKTITDLVNQAKGESVAYAPIAIN